MSLHWRQVEVLSVRHRQEGNRERFSDEVISSKVVLQGSHRDKQEETEKTMTWAWWPDLQGMMVIRTSPHLFLILSWKVPH